MSDTPSSAAVAFVTPVAWYWTVMPLAAVVFLTGQADVSGIESVVNVACTVSGMLHAAPPPGVTISVGFVPALSAWVTLTVIPSQPVVVGSVGPKLPSVIVRVPEATTVAAICAPSTLAVPV